MNQVCNQFRKLSDRPRFHCKAVGEEHKEKGCCDEPMRTVDAQPSPQRASGKTITGQIQRNTLTAGATGISVRLSVSQAAQEARGRKKPLYGTSNYHFHLAWFAYSSIIYGGMTFGPVGYLIYVCYFHYKLWMELMYLLFFCFKVLCPWLKIQPTCSIHFNASSL